MSTHSARTHSKGRIQDIQRNGHMRRGGSFAKRRVISTEEAWSYALRAAYLEYLLQPRQKRLQHVPAPKPLQKAATAMTEIVKDLSGVGGSKSTKLPHGILATLDKRLSKLIPMEIEQLRAEYDALKEADERLKQTFAIFLNECRKPEFMRSIEKDRRAEDLLLIFFSTATKRLQMGKAPDDDSWRPLVDKDVAIFVGLLNIILTQKGADKELVKRLADIQVKIKRHDQDLADQSQKNGGAGGHTIEIEVPRSYEVKDMPLAMSLQRIFNKSYAETQEEIDRNKAAWTEEAAMKDLKTYQAYLSLNNKRTLTSDDFDLDEAYEDWKKAEVADISQMILAIMKSNPELAKSSTSAGMPQFKASNASIDSGYSEMSRKMSDPSADDIAYAVDQPVDMTGLSLEDNSLGDGETPYTFIPPDPRAYYRAMAKQAFTSDLDEPDKMNPIFTKASMEVLSDIATRWRVPLPSRLILLLDSVKEKLQLTEIGLDTLDAAFDYVKENLAQPQLETKKSNRMSMIAPSSLSDRSKWPIVDYALFQGILSAVHDILLRDFFEAMLDAYAAKGPRYNMVLGILQAHVYSDPLFAKSPEDLDVYWDQLGKALKQRAEESYEEMLGVTLPATQDEWEFYHVIELGKLVLSLAEKIQKRYKKLPPFIGVSPVMVLTETILPAYIKDARELLKRIMEQAEAREELIPIQDAFDLYKELVHIRNVHHSALPSLSFGMDIEGLLQPFVWRWIETTDANIEGWVEGALKHDNFTIRTEHPDQEPTEDERHSVSVIDIFRSFNQSIEAIIALNWQDRFQYAKFMTKLSKSVGNGIAKYCDLVEQKFAKEMDRMTPEQEVAAQQTRQQKWMKLAKDAWNNQEKVEPYQFLSESLVKLNNIEHAMLQLDKLEHELDVDALAAEIQKHTPPATQRMRQPSNYVFTIKIIEAEDLKACDINGLSDPYVVLGDEYQKRLAKTRVVYSNLNPRWDETIDIVTQGPLNIIATIWDWDALGDHDCVGRTSLKLDPSHFRDYMPREYWLDLDTQGRLLLRVSMEGERDDIQFYFGKAFRTLKRTERDMTRKITDKLSAYIHYSLSRRALKALLSRGISISSISNVSSFFQRNRPQSVALQPQGPTPADIENALKPLFTYFDENFALMKQTLTDSSMKMVMTRVWKEVLVTIEALLVPPLSDKPSQQRPLTQQELDIVFKWLQLLYEFFNARDEETGEANGVPQDILKSPKWHDIQSLNFFYFEPTENLIRISESMASASAARQQEQAARLNRLSAPASLAGNPHQFGGAAGMLGLPSRRHKTIMMSKNLGTMRKAKEEKRKEAQAEPSDDIILRILRMRPEAERYLKDRSRQKERLAAAAAAEMIVRQSLTAGGGRMAGQLGRR